jgi:tetratricopeptide (TPR) repeat protein
MGAHMRIQTIGRAGIMYKAKAIFLLKLTMFFLLISLTSVLAESIILKSGKRIQGKILKETENYIRIKEDNGKSETYSAEEIAQIEEEGSSLINNNINPTAQVLYPIVQLVKEAEGYFTNKDYENAALTFQKIIELTTDNRKRANYFFGQGICLYKSGKTDEAILSFNKAIDLKPNEIDFYLCLGSIYKKLGNMPKAEEYFSKALELSKYNKNLLKSFFAEILLEEPK